MALKHVWAYPMLINIIHYVWLGGVPPVLTKPTNVADICRRHEITSAILSPTLSVTSRRIVVDIFDRRPITASVTDAGFDFRLPHVWV